MNTIVMFCIVMEPPGGTVLSVDKTFKEVKDVKKHHTPFIL